MFQFTRTFLLFAIFVSTVEGAEQNQLADFKSEAEGLQEEFVAKKWPSGNEKCIHGFTYVPSTGRCYKVVWESHDWYSAAKRCREVGRGSYLAAITSAKQSREVNAFLATQISRNLDNPACFVRGHTAWGQMYWTSGQLLVKNNCKSPFVWKQSSDKLLAFDYTNWNGGEPNCGNNGEFCLVIQVYANFRWDDMNCSEKTCPLCEYAP